MLASTTQPVDWTARITLWGAIATAAITVATAVALYALTQFKKIRDAMRDLRTTTETNTQNIATSATSLGAVIKAQQASPGPNTPPEVGEAVRQVAETPTVPIDAPTQTTPVVTTPTPEAQARAFDGAKHDST